MRSSGAEPIARLVLDTSAYSHFRAGNPRIIDVLKAATSILIPVTVIGELCGAFELGRRTKENHLALARFLAEPFVSVLPTTPEVASQYGRIYARQRIAGKPVAANAMWIAAATVDCGGHLVTFDGDFARIPGLDCTVLSA